MSTTESKSIFMIGIVALFFFLVGSLQAATIRFEDRTERTGAEYRSFEMAQPNVEICRETCAREERCKAFTYFQPGVRGEKAVCSLKSSEGSTTPNDSAISGVKVSASPPAEPQPAPDAPYYAPPPTPPADPYVQPAPQPYPPQPVEQPYPSQPPQTPYTQPYPGMQPQPYPPAPIAAPPPGFITVFSGSKFTKESQALQPGRYSSLDDSLRDEISSIILTGNVRVILYDKKNFQGKSTVLERSSSDLGEFKNKAASLVIEPATRAFITAFKETGFSGSAREFEPGRYAKLNDGWDDEIESIDLTGNVRVILFDDKNFSGKQMIITSDTMDLSSFGKEADSMIVEQVYY